MKSWDEAFLLLAKEYFDFESQRRGLTKLYYIMIDNAPIDGRGRGGEVEPMKTTVKKWASSHMPPTIDRISIMLNQGLIAGRGGGGG